MTFKKDNFSVFEQETIKLLGRISKELLVLNQGMKSLHQKYFLLYQDVRELKRGKA